MNYQIELDKIININIEKNRIPSLLLHSCCAPCSSYVIEYLSQYFRITVFFYNPNIFPQNEYNKRLSEQKKLISSMDTKHPVSFIEKDYDTSLFMDAVKGYESCAEGGERCLICYNLRLYEAAKAAKEGGFDYFTTTLTISPLKKAEKINEIGILLAGQLEAEYLISDFKKRNGYKRSIELSKQYGLYRQDYCGCVFSRRKNDVH